MNITNVSNYVRSGNIFTTKKEFRKQAIVFLILSVGCGIILGAALGGWWLLIGLAMILIAAIFCVIIYNVSSYTTITLERYMTMNVILYTGWVLEFSFLEFMFFIMWKGFHPTVFLFFFPQIIIPLVMGILTHRKLMKDTEYKANKIKKSQIIGVSFGAGLAGIALSRRLRRNVDQATLMVVCLIGCAIIATLMSIGLLSILKLYYIKKYGIEFDAELSTGSDSNAAVEYTSKSAEMDTIPFAEVDRTHNVNDFLDKSYVMYDGGRCAKCFFDEYAAVENYKAVAFHYVDGEKYKGIKNYQTLFVLDVYYKKETFFEVSDRILTEHLGQDAKSYFATFDETLDVQFNGCTIKKNKFPYIENNATVLFDPRYHTIRYVFYVHNTGGVEDAKFAIKQTLRIYENAHRNDWIFDYSDLVDSNSSVE